MTGWREHAANQDWDRIDGWAIPDEEISELYEILERHVPLKQRGHGLDFFEGPIFSDEASSGSEKAAADLIHRVLVRIQNKELLENIGRPFQKAVAEAIKIIEGCGFKYCGLADTFVYEVSSDSFVQLDTRVGRAVCSRRQKMLDSLSGADFDTWCDLYPWRDCDTLQGWMERSRFVPYSPLYYAVNLLIAHQSFRTILSMELARGGGARSRKGKVNLAIVLLEAGRYGYLIGHMHRSLSGKWSDAHTLRGLNNLLGSRRSAQDRLNFYKPIRDARLARMGELVPEVGVDKAAAHCETEGLGGWQAIKRQWNREKKRDT